jgi:heavy metal sensor kinase
VRVASLRARLTLFYVSALAVGLLSVGGLIYVLLAEALYSRIDDNLHALLQITNNSLRNDLEEGQDHADAARSTAAELSSREQMLAIYNSAGRLLAEAGRDKDLEIILPDLSSIRDDPVMETVAERQDRDDRHRLAVRRVEIPRFAVSYIVVAGSSLERTDDELEELRLILLYVVPLALAVAAIGGWFLAHRGLSPVAAMVAMARRIGAEDLSARLPVMNPDDELGRLAATFNDLLGRLEAALTQQRQFMADASHELRTPVTTTRTAATVALQRLHREERDYRETLEIVEQQTIRLSRIVDDMFTLARADAGNYPVRRDPMYLDEIVEEVARAARVVAAARSIAIDIDAVAPAPFTGDEELIQRLLVNLIDNAVRHAPDGTAVEVKVANPANGYAIVVSDRGPGIPAESQRHIFERFYRADPSRTRLSGGGAGLGLALVRWIAEVHGGSAELSSSSSAGSTFTVFLPAASG